MVGTEIKTDEKPVKTTLQSKYEIWNGSTDGKIYNELLPKFRVGQMVYRKLDKPRNALGNKQSTDAFREGDFRLDIVEPRKIKRILYYNTEPYYRYILNDVPNVSYPESELRLATERREKFIILRLIGRMKRNGITYYKCVWKNAKQHRPSWEPRTELIKDIPDMVEEYDNKLHGRGLIADDDEKLPPIISRMGGKSKLADKIIKLFPPDKLIKTYVELFIGGGSVFFKKKPAMINIINDLDKDIYDIYHDIQKVDNINDFDFEGNKETFERLKLSHPTNPRDRLYRNLYISDNSMMGSRQGFGTDIRYNDMKTRGIRRKQNYNKYRDKLQNTIILNENYKNVIKKYDKSDTLFYLDPQYSEQKKLWGYEEGKNITPENLLEELKKIKGYFLMSYDYSEKNKKLFEQYFKVKIVKTVYNVKDGSREVKELIVMNYDPQTIKKLSI